MIVSRISKVSKFFVAVVLAVCGSLLLSVGAASSASAETVFESSTNGDGTLTITSCIDCTDTVVIPSEISGAQVTAIGDNAFSRLDLTSVTIPNTVRSIGVSAFSSNKLTSITLPTSLKTLKADAFSWNELKSVVIPDSVVTIGDSAFHMNKISSLTLGNSVTTIGDCAFCMNNLRKLTIPSSVTKIGNIAFANNHFSSVVVPETVTSMGFEVFLARIPNGDPTPNYRGGAAITGVAKSGSLLTVNKGLWESEKKASYSYQWYSCAARNRWAIRADKIPAGCKAIAVAAGKTFKVTKNEKNKFVTVLITAKSSFGSTKILPATLAVTK